MVSNYENELNLLIEIQKDKKLLNHFEVFCEKRNLNKKYTSGTVAGLAAQFDAAEVCKNFDLIKALFGFGIEINTGFCNEN